MHRGRLQIVLGGKCHGGLNKSESEQAVPSPVSKCFPFVKKKIGHIMTSCCGSGGLIRVQCQGGGEGVATACAGNAPISAVRYPKSELLNAI